MPPLNLRKGGRDSMSFRFSGNLLFPAFCYEFLFVESVKYASQCSLSLLFLSSFCQVFSMNKSLLGKHLCSWLRPFFLVCTLRTGSSVMDFHTFALSQHDSRCCIPCSTSPVPQFNKDPSFSSSSMGKQHISGAFSAPIHWIGKTTSRYLSFMQRAQVHSPAKHGVHSSLFSRESWGPPCGQYTRYLLPLGYILPAHAVGLFFIISHKDWLIHWFIVCAYVSVCVCVNFINHSSVEVTERIWCVLTPPFWSRSSRHHFDQGLPGMSSSV